MKKNTLKTILIILIIVLIGLVSFGGIYVKNLNKMKNVVKDYNYGMDFSKTLLVGLKVDDSVENQGATDVTAENPDTTAENPEATENDGETKENTEAVPEKKEIVKGDVDSVKTKIKNRLEALGVNEFYIRTNYTDGSVMLEIPNGTDTKFISDITAVGAFTVEDSDGNVLGDSGIIKDVKYTLDRTSYKVPCVKIEVKFKNDFIKNLVNNQNNYASTTDEQGNVVDKKISLKVDSTDIYSDKAVDLIDDVKLSDTLTLFLGKADSTEEELQDYYTSAAILTTIMKDGKMPLKYKVDVTDVLKSNLDINSVVIVGLVILGIATIWAIYKHKSKGAFAVIALIGYIGTMLLLIRYTNGIVAFEGIFALALIFGIEYAFNLKFISNAENTKEKMMKVYTKTLMQFINVFVVSFIIAIVFSLQAWVPIKSFGTIMFWGIIILVAYNYLVTKNLIESVRNKK